LWQGTRAILTDKFGFPELISSDFPNCPAGISAQFAKRDASDPLPILHATWDLPLKAVPDGTRALVIFDEFQAVQSVPELDAIIRSHIQHQREVASFVFAGSEQGMLNALFADVAKPAWYARQ
jgi:hypothetical protein